MKQIPIILLEDDVFLRDLVAEGLRFHKFEVVEVGDLDRASAIIDDLAGRAILVADRRIEPDARSGFQIADAALRKHPHLKVVYTSGSHVALRHRSYSARERSLLKPFAVSQLVAAISQL